MIGNFHYAFLRGINLGTPSPNDTIPAFVFIAYQMMFAIITPALISGAFTNRVTFKSYMLFLTGWLTFVYFPFVHMVWGGGFLQQWGVLDFAGGIVVHNIAGIAALASVSMWASAECKIAARTAFRWSLWVPDCCGLDGMDSTPAAKCALIPSPRRHFSIPTLPRLLPPSPGSWSRGSTRKSQNSSACSPAPSPDWRPSLLLPDYVSPTTAVIIGIVSGVVCYYAVEMKNKMHWDDALDVWGVHGVGGFLGIVMLGIFANKQFNPEGANGLLYGDPVFLLKQVDGRDLLLRLGVRIHLRHAAHH